MHYASLSQNLETYLVIGAALFGLGSWAMWKWERVSQRAQRDETAS